MKRFGLLLVFASGCFLSSCVSRVSIARLLSNPYRYQNKEVRIGGRVTSSVNAIIAGGYQVDDGSGKVTVLSNGGPPKKGSNVVLTGRVSPAVSVFGQSFGVVVRERNRDVLAQPAKN